MVLKDMVEDLRIIKKIILKLDKDGIITLKPSIKASFKEDLKEFKEDVEG